MIIYPAIDLKDGACVRLLRGDMNDATIFSDSPAAQAKEFEEAGFTWLHVVDLDGACAGKTINYDSVKAIIDTISIPVQLGGGIRSMEDIDRWLDAGLSRVILGTAAAKNPQLVCDACKKHPRKIAIGIDARGGMVAVEGWVDTATLRATDLALKFEDAGAAAIIYTDIDCDGALLGPNLEETQRLAQRLSTPVILSGGVTSKADLARIKAAGANGIEGAIIGRALYERTISYQDALSV